MKSLEKKSVRIFLMDFYSFYCNACQCKERMRYSKTQTLSEYAFYFLADEIGAYTGEKYLGIDLANIVSYPMRLFSKLPIQGKKVFFYNVTESTLRARMEEDLSNLVWIREDVACCDSRQKTEIEHIIDDECSNARHDNIARIVNEVMFENTDVPYRLASSGMFSNCYLSAKKLFTEVEDFYAILFAMAGLVDQLQGVDALVTSSKNGAIIATILGDLLQIKEVHLLGVGPKYSMELEDSVECLKEGKRYLYIFDFLCTGAELKVVSALINSKKAILRGAVGISRYQKGIPSADRYEINVLMESTEMKEPYILVGNSGLLQSTKRRH